MKEIKLSKEKKAQLCRTFGVSRVTVWSALTFGTKSELARKIRSAALKLGGVVEYRTQCPAGFMPNCKTSFDHDNEGHVSRITQLFANGVGVVLMGDEKTAIVSRNGRHVKTYTDVEMRDWGQIVFDVQSLSDTLNSQTNQQ